MNNPRPLFRLGLAGMATASLATAVAAEQADRALGPSVAGDPSCAMTPVVMTAGADGSQTATALLENRSGTLVRDGVAALPLSGQPGLVVIDARWADATRTSGPDIEIVQCEAANTAALLPEGVKVKPTRGLLGSLARAVEGDEIVTAPQRPRRLDRSYERNVAAKGQPARSRAALTLSSKTNYVVLIGGAPPGTSVTASILRPGDDRPPTQPLQLPVTRGAIDGNSARQNASLRPYALYDLKVDSEGPVLFRGTATSPLFLEVGDVSDDGAYDWFGLRRAGTAGNADAEVERLMLWRTQMEPGKESVFGLVLKPGSYLVRVRGVTPESTGDYTVTKIVPQATDLLRIPDPEPIKPGVTRGTLVIGDSFSQDADGAPQFRPTRLYQFAGKAGTGYEVRLDSDGPELDPFLGAGGMLPVLETPKSNNQRTDAGERFFALLANNDHANVAGMKSATSSCLFFTARKNGPIVLKVIGTRVNQAGGYTLTLKETPTGCLPAGKP